MGYRIYALVCPIKMTFVYIGVTGNPVFKRLKEHITDNSNNNKSNWIKSLKKKNLKPNIFTLDFANTKEEALKLEGEWIKKLINKGYPLLNKSKTGKFTEVPKPTPVRIPSYIIEILKKQADALGITLHKHLVTTLEKQAKKPIKK